MQQDKRRQQTLDRARRMEDKSYRARVSDVVCARMEYLRAEGERLRAELEESVQSAKEEDHKREIEAKQERERAELERQRVEEEKRLQAEQERQEEERIRAEQERIRIEERLRVEEAERLRADEERAQAERVAAAELLLEFSEQVKDIATQTDQAMTNDTCIQTENCGIDSLKEENESEVRDSAFGVTQIQGNDQKTKFYTGLPTWGVFLHIFCFISPCVSPSSKLCLEDEMLLVLVRLRLGLFMQDIANRFKIPLSVASKVFQTWLDVMFIRLAFLISWPKREINHQNMPAAFKNLYPQCRCIIDCSEIFIETPKCYNTRSKTYSNYKKHNTIKFLIGITPVGTISYLSQCWGGRVSDKNLTQKSNFFQMLEHGDTVLADRGFTIAEDLAVHGAKLEIPAFTRGKTQLSQRDVELSKQLSSVRIHVERVIGHLKNKYTLLKGPLPVTLLKHKGDKGYANIDKILVVCAALTNLSLSIV